MIRKIGVGGMGETWLALQLGAEDVARPVAIKTLLASQFRSQLIREARVLARLNHPNLVQLISFEERQGQLQLVMEWVHGLNLEELLYKIGAYFSGPEKHKLQIFAWLMIEVLNALLVCHQRDPKIIHGDITPRNILISRNGCVKLADFGIARFQNESQATQYGKPNWMAPECFHQNVCDTQSDIYQVGRVFEHLLQHCHANVRLKKRLKGVAQKALQENAQERCQAQSFIKAIETVFRRHQHWKEHAQERLKTFMQTHVMDTESLLNGDDILTQKVTPRQTNTEKKPFRFAMLAVASMLFLGVLLQPSVLNIRGGKIWHSSRYEVRQHNGLDEARKPCVGEDCAAILVQARPWAYVYINTIQMGSTPKKIELQPGTYQFELYHPNYEKRIQRQLHLKPNEVFNVVYDLRE